jgi:hypothetical protein
MQWRRRPLIYKKTKVQFPCRFASPRLPRPNFILIPDFLSGSASLPRFAAFLDLAESPAVAPEVPRFDLIPTWHDSP